MSDENGQVTGDSAGSETAEESGAAAAEQAPQGLVASLRRRWSRGTDDAAAPDPASSASGQPGWNDWISANPPAEEDAMGDGQAAGSEEGRSWGSGLLGRRDKTAALVAESPSTTVPDTDPGWVLHERQEDGSGYDGWLYHFADGEIVDQDGSPIDLSAVPTADLGIAEPEAQPEDAVEAQPEPEAAAEPEAQPGPQPEPEPDPEAAAEPEPEPEVLVVPQAQPETTETTTPPEPQAEDQVTAVPQATKDDDPALQPVAAEVTDWTATHRRNAAEEDLPTYVTYSTGAVMTAVLGLVVLVGGVLTVLALCSAIHDETSSMWLRAGALLVVTVAAYVALGQVSSVVTVRDGVLEVSRGGRTDSADLRDPSVVATGKDPASRGWSMRVQRPDRKDLVIRSSQVKPRQFARIVDHHQAHPRSED